MVSVQPDDAEVRIDGELITVKPYRIAVDAKGHRLVVSKDGFESRAESISIKDHGRTIEAKLTPVVAAGGPQAPAGPLAIPPPADDKAAGPNSAVLAPEQSEWVGLGTIERGGSRRTNAAAVRIVERRGRAFKATTRTNAVKLMIEGTVADGGEITHKVSEVVEAANSGWPLDKLTGTGEVGKSWMKLVFNDPDTGGTARYELKRLPDDGADFNFVGRWKVFHRPSGWKNEYTVHGEGTFIAWDRQQYTWDHDGGVATFNFANGGHEWLAIDPDKPNELSGSNGPQSVTWIRQ